jgi:sugar O-acyltransferase (sialic acid O-acetyltransferase NeuD family)
MTSHRTWILGQGGLARETIQLLNITGKDVNGDSLEFVAALTAEEEAEILDERGRLVLGIGDAAVRVKLMDSYADHEGLSFATLVHPRADVGQGTQLGRGVTVTSGCVVTTDVVIEDGVLLNLCSTVGHDAILGRGTVINPGVNVSGSVRIGAGVLVGTGATILQGLNVGDGATIGAGAVVTKDVPPGVVVAGVPAKALAR